MTDKEWYYAKDRRQMGPVTAAKLADLYLRGEVSDTDLVWTSGMVNWAPAGEMRERFGVGSGHLSEIPTAEPASVSGTFESILGTGSSAECSGPVQKT